jgi:hypothetical protein
MMRPVFNCDISVRDTPVPAPYVASLDQNGPQQT